MKEKKSTMRMLPKERLRRVFSGEPVDRAPVICPGGMMNMVTKGLMDEAGTYLPEAHTDPRKMADLAKAVYELHCFENVGVPFCMTVEAEALGAFVDLGSELYEPRVTEYCLEQSSDYRKLPPFSPDTGRTKTVLDAICILHDEVTDAPVVGNLTGPVSIATSLLDPITFYKDMRRNKAAAKALTEAVTDHLIAFGKAQVAAGADLIVISEPSGTGEILGPEMFYEFVTEPMNRLIGELKAMRVRTVVHICGQMKRVFREAEMIASDALSFDAVVPLKLAGENVSSHLVMGNVSTYTIEMGNEQEVMRLAKNCAANGADIIAPACGLGMHSPLRNVQAILKAMEEEGVDALA